MALNAENGRLELDGGSMDYVRFGRGEQDLVILPGLGDAFRTVKGLALPFALGYRRLAEDFTVWLFSRPEPLPDPCSTREMARDLGRAMDTLGLERICLLGASQGGMIAQWVAIDQPKRVDRLVLAASAAGGNPTLQNHLLHWVTLARSGDYKGILTDTALLSYSAKTVKRQRLAAAATALVTKPESFARFLIQAAACLQHDAREDLPRIFCPTLVLGGTEDGIVTADACRELAREIVGAELYLYEGLSHAFYEEAKDFQERVAVFCKNCKAEEKD